MRHRLGLSPCCSRSLAYQQWTCGQCHQRRNTAGYTLYVGPDRAQFP